MQLYLNGAESHGISVWLIANGKAIAQGSAVRTRQPRSRELNLVAKFIPRQKLGQLTAVAVANRAAEHGGATFSQLRASVVCANAIAYACGIPAFGVPPLSAEDFARRERSRIAQVHRVTPVMPRYQRPPNITVSKNSRPPKLHERR